MPPKARGLPSTVAIEEGVASALAPAPDPGPEPSYRLSEAGRMRLMEVLHTEQQQHIRSAAVFGELLQAFSELVAERQDAP